MALFGRNTVREVRVVTIGDYSVELVSGTHVEKLVCFRIVKKKESVQVPDLS